MAKTKMTQTEKLLNALTAGETFTAKQAARKFRMPVENVGKRVFDLRNEGYCIYANKVAGTKQVSYRLGTPSRAIVAAGFRAMRDAA